MRDFIGGAIWGLLLMLAGFTLHDWQFWLLMFASAATFQIGVHMKPHS